MSRITSLNAERLYVITLKGQVAIKAEPLCMCSYRWQDGMLVCMYCGTGVAVARQLPLPQGLKRD